MKKGVLSLSLLLTLSLIPAHSATHPKAGAACSKQGTTKTYQNKKFKNTGVLSGVSDLVVLLDRKTIFVELKTSTMQKEAQIKFQSIVENLGFDYYIIRSLNNFKDMLNKHV